MRISLLLGFTGWLSVLQPANNHLFVVDFVTIHCTAAYLSYRNCAKVYKEAVAFLCRIYKPLIYTFPHKFNYQTNHHPKADFAFCRPIHEADKYFEFSWMVMTLWLMVQWQAVAVAIKRITHAEFSPCHSVLTERKKGSCGESFLCVSQLVDFHRNGIKSY